MSMRRKTCKINKISNNDILTRIRERGSVDIAERQSIAYTLRHEGLLTVLQDWQENFRDKRENEEASGSIVKIVT